MKKIINEKLYDTEKCTLILKYFSPVAYSNVFFSKYYQQHHTSIYKTTKGTYLKYIGKPKDELINPKSESLEIITKEDLKSLLIKLNDIDTYEKEIGKLEEG